MDRQIAVPADVEGPGDDRCVEHRRRPVALELEVGLWEVDRARSPRALARSGGRESWRPARARFGPHRLVPIVGVPLSTIGDVLARHGCRLRAGWFVQHPDGRGPTCTRYLLLPSSQRYRSQREPWRRSWPRVGLPIDRCRCATVNRLGGVVPLDERSGARSGWNNAKPASPVPNAMKSVPP